jgi:hypothetical protein
MGKFIDISGERFGRLQVISVAERAAHGSCVKWNCICDCGKKVIVSGKLLRNGHTQSCGCFAIHILKERSITHGLSQKRDQNHRLYSIWCAMKRRCYKPKDIAYQYYGGKGIKVCIEWHNFIPFMDWALKNGYNEKITIDRKDSNKDYCPENCQWLTREENSRKAQEWRREATA